MHNGLIVHRPTIYSYLGRYTMIKLIQFVREILFIKHYCHPIKCSSYNAALYKIDS